MEQLDLKWSNEFRPSKLDTEFVGNAHTVQKFNKMLALHKLPNCLLFKGKAGVGKTTLARNIALSLKCENRIGGQACGECENCTKITKEFIKEGKTPRHSGIFEIDITNSNTRDEASRLASEMKQRGLAKDTISVYILDEIQRATKEAQSTLLKVLEEAPKNIFVMVCTTNPEQLIEPFRKRFVEFNITTPTTDEMVEKLKIICNTKQVKYSVSGLKYLVKKSHNVPRDCINLMEMVSATGEVSKTNIQKDLYITSDEIYNKFLSACLNGNLSQVVIEVNNIIETENIALDKFLEGFCDFLTMLLEIKAGIKLDDYTVTELKDKKKLVNRFTDENYIDMLEILSDYSKTLLNAEFQIIALAVAIMDVLKVDEHIQEYSEEKVANTYNKVTKKVTESKPKPVKKRLNEDDISNVIPESKKVRAVRPIKPVKKEN